MSTGLRVSARHRPAHATNAWRSAFVFLDETGTLHSPRDRFFAVGLLKCPDPSLIQRSVQRLRESSRFATEFKWADLTRDCLVPLYKRLVDCFFACASASFACHIADKRTADPIHAYGNQWVAYENLACRLIVAHVGSTEHLIVLADEYSTPAQVTFEANVRDCVNTRLREKHVIGICRMRSSGVDLFQVLDVLLGAVAYDYKRHAGVLPGSGSPPKLALLHHIRSRLRIPQFVGGVATARCSVSESV